MIRVKVAARPPRRRNRRLERLRARDAVARPRPARVCRTGSDRLESASRQVLAKRHRTLAGLAKGDFIVDIDGRTFADAEAVVVCEGTADIRFFLATRRRAALRRG